jgi:hypothetical protein
LSDTTSYTFCMPIISHVIHSFFLGGDDCSIFSWSDVCSAKPQTPTV